MNEIKYNQHAYFSEFFKLINLWVIKNIYILILLDLLMFSINFIVTKYINIAV